MASDYVAIRKSNREEYGAGIGRWGKDLLTILYDNRTHFIFELLQNAEDALSRRTHRKGSRAVVFALAGRELCISHFGRPFDEHDVRGICGIAESTKDLTAIGRFGIGFKSVYTFSERPEVHSGAEDFAIENFVWPIAVPTLARATDETIIKLALKSKADQQAIAKGLQRLGPRTLLFLRHIEEIEWRVENGLSGRYQRNSPEILAEGVRRVTVHAQEQRRPPIEEKWLVFSRPVRNKAVSVGFVEIAFSIVRNGEDESESVRRIDESPLVVFFPTVLSTNLGFLVQGPYRTTPSRDNVPADEPWNQHLVKEASALLVEALRWLRDQSLLNVDALCCLPLNSGHFGETNMFAPLFEATKRALVSEALLPRFDGGYVKARSARLARTQDLRELLSPAQLGALLDDRKELVWLRGDITQDRAPELRQYLVHELDITEITPESIVPRLDKTFLEAQNDDWIRRLYEFLNGQPALIRYGRLDDLPLVRLHSGVHVTASVNGQPQVFLPASVETGFPTVHRSVCNTPEARRFLQSLGLTEPDAVDDVVWNVLPKYRSDEADVSAANYKADVKRIVVAFGTDSKAQREKLLAALRETTFVMAVDGDGSECVAQPENLYLATERLKDLFSGIPGVLLVDERYTCLRGEDVRELLEACGASRYLKPIAVESGFTWQDRAELRKGSAHVQTSGQNDRDEDWWLYGLGQVLTGLTTLNGEMAAAKARALWEAIGDVETRRGQSFFTGTYRWTHYGSHSLPFPSRFVRHLNEFAWVPTENRGFERPQAVLFDDLGWKPSPFLQSKIRFKPPIVHTLAKEAGIEPGVLDLLIKLGLTSEAGLRDRLHMFEVDPLPSQTSPHSVGEVSSEVEGDAFEARRGAHDSPEASPSLSQVCIQGPLGGAEGGASSPGGRNETQRRDDRLGESAGKQPMPATAQGRQFISFVATFPDEDEKDPDGLNQADRMALEERAIALIVNAEPALHRTSTHNPGFDLFEQDMNLRPTRWVEVKAMTGNLRDRPVGLTYTQFECAREHGAAFWLYVVEHAGDDSARIVRIRDPWGKARTFTFDHGWLDVSDRESQ